MILTIIGIILFIIIISACCCSDRNSSNNETTTINTSTVNNSSYQYQSNKSQPNNGGYCNLNCKYCYEEFLNSSGGIVGEFNSEGYVEYNCRLGHTVSIGSFCKDYE